MNRSIKNIIDERLKAIVSPEDLAARIRMRAHSRVKRFNVPVRRIFSLAATFCLIAILSVSVMAASIPQLTQLFILLGDKVANLVQPIIKTSEDNGIKMEVLAALNDNDTAIIYLTLQDIAQNRIDETTELYNLEIPGIIFPTAELINFDDASRIATYKIVGMQGNKLNESKLSIKLTTLLSGNKTTKYTDTGLTIKSIAQLNPTPQLCFPKSINESTTNFDTQNPPFPELTKLDPDVAVYLKPDDFSLDLNNCDWAYLSGCGIIDGALHLQVNPDNKSGRYNRIGFAITNEKGEPIPNLFVTTAAFGSLETETIHQYSDFIENIYLLPKHDNLDDYKIYSYQSTYDKRIDGNWSTTFKLKSNTQVKKADCIINMNPWEITGISVSAIGVTIQGTGQMYEYSTSPEITVKRVDGSVVECNSSSSSSFENLKDGTEMIVIQNMFRLPLDIKEIASVNINGIDIALK